MTWLYLNDTVLQKRNTFFVINSTAEIRQDTLSYTLTTQLRGGDYKGASIEAIEAHKNHFSIIKAKSSSFASRSPSFAVSFHFP